ncbi:EamA family transporter [Micromonospora rifamycinica]|uniref:DMT family transporter n=1 Tax=Micromonospora rifamycinica TaxID=291594 RepID=UPI0033DB027A
MDHSTAPSHATAQRRADRFADAGRQGALLVLVAAVLWGTTGASQALAPQSSALGVATVRLCTGGLVLLTWALAGGVAGMAACWTRATWWLTTIGVSSVAAYQGLFFSAVRSTGVATGTLIAIGSAPLITGLLGLLIKERLSRAWTAGTALTVAGLALLSVPGDTVVVRLSGVLYALAAAAAYSTYTVVGRMLLSRGVDGRVVVGTFFGFACLPIVAVSAGEDFGWLASWNGIGVALWLGIGATAVPYLVWIRGLKTTAVSSATAIGLAEPLTASALGIFVLGERATGWTLLGMATIVAGLAVVGRDGADTARPAPPRQPVAPAPRREPGSPPTGVSGGA